MLAFNLALSLLGTSMLLYVLFSVEKPIFPVILWSALFYDVILTVYNVTRVIRSIP